MRHFKSTKFLLLLLIWRCQWSLASAPAQEQTSEDLSRKPQWQRTLSDEDAARAKDLKQKIDQLQDEGDYGTALVIGEELLALRTKRQGTDHWQTISQKYQVIALKKVGGLTEEKRRAWKQAENDAFASVDLLNQGRFAAALSAMQPFAELCVEILGEEHPETATCYKNMAVTLFPQGKHTHAHEFAEKALSIRRKVLGEAHPDTASSYYHVASSLNSQGKPDEAQVLHAKALEIRRKVLGEEHFETANSYNLTAVGLNSLGKPAEAQPLFQRALDIRRKVLGEEHRETVESLNNIAINLNNLGERAKAQAYFEKALNIRLKVLGEDHADTANSYHSVAYNLNSQGKPAEARPYYQKALDIRRKVLGEEHPDTANSYENAAANLDDLGKLVEARHYFQKSLDIRRKVLGEEHPDTATGYNNMASNLESLGRLAEAQALHQEALDIRRRVLGDKHSDTADSYNNLASTLKSQGKVAEAQQLYQKALGIYRQVLGEEHPNTAAAYHNLASTLESQGKPYEAQPLYKKALNIRRTALGENHLGLAASYNNLASCLDDLGRSVEALPLFQRALDISLEALGEEHPQTATSYNNVALNLWYFGKPTEAQPLFQKALEIRRRVLGAEHPDTASSYHNVASILHYLDLPADALPHLQTALKNYRQVLGEEHPRTAETYNFLAFNLHALGRPVDAEAVLNRAVYSYESSRLVQSVGLDRALLTKFNPRHLLAAIQASIVPEVAWATQELSFARSLLDQQASHGRSLLSSVELADQARQRSTLETVQPQILYLVSKSERNAEESQTLNDFLTQRRTAEERLAALSVIESQRSVASPDLIRSTLPTDAALLFWVDVSDRKPSDDHIKRTHRVEEHWACIVRSTGEPKWERLPGSGPDHNWDKADSFLPELLRTELKSGLPENAKVNALFAKLATQRLSPILKHLNGVKTLYVVPADEVAGIPIEAMTDQFTISYVPSGTFLARLKDKPRPNTTGVLALGDPVYDVERTQKPLHTNLPPGGILVEQVVPGGNAEKVAGIKQGDVLLAYAGVELKTVDDLTAEVAKHLNDKSISVKVWRESEDQPSTRELPPGKLGVILAKEPAPEVIAKRREADQLLASINRGGDWHDLPGTRLELQTLSDLFPVQVTVLSDQAASESQIEKLRQADGLKKFRYLHFASHGMTNDLRAFDSALILSQNDPLKQEFAPIGAPWINGQITAREVLDYWKLDAELVTLSACQTGLGKSGGGDGLLGFAQAFLLAGSRSVCLSLWEVDDRATALLMDRFYRNLLGKRDGLANSMPKAAALHEAKQWLRNLTQDEVAQRLTGLTNGVSRAGGRPALKVVAPTIDPKSDPKQVKPFDNPRYWAAFILIGDPN